MKDFKSKCACSASGIGICLCTVFMGIGMAGAALVGVSKNSNDMQGMVSATNSAASSTISQNVIVNFFSGFWGEVILLISFGLMFYGMWSSGGNRKKLIPLSAAGAVILYASMYAYFSLALEIVGAIVLTVTYVSVYNYRIAAAIKLA